jgi:hypothetical protein
LLFNSKKTTKKLTSDIYHLFVAKQQPSNRTAVASKWSIIFIQKLQAKILCDIIKGTARSKASLSQNKKKSFQQFSNWEISLVFVVNVHRYFPRLNASNVFVYFFSLVPHMFSSNFYSLITDAEFDR